jgi:hypothetical protein
MKKLKKIWLFLLGIVIIFWFSYQCMWSLSIRDHNKKTWSQKLQRSSDWKFDWETLTSADPIWSWSKYIGDKGTWIIHLPHASDYDTELWYLLALIKIGVNRILWILASVVLVYMLYCWFLVLSTGSDDKNATKWKKWIKNAAIAIAWIGLAWLIISVMIRFISVITTTN